MKVAYRLWDNALEHGRASWDQTAVLYAVRGAAEDWGTAPRSVLSRGRRAHDLAGRRVRPSRVHGERRSAENLTRVIGDLMAMPPRCKSSRQRAIPCPFFPAGPHARIMAGSVNALDTFRGQGSPASRDS